MSDLLHSVLTARLSNTILSSPTSTSDRGGTDAPAETLQDWESIESDDEQLVNVASVPPTSPGTPLASRPVSPGPHPTAPPSRLAVATAPSGQDSDDNGERAVGAHGRGDAAKREPRSTSKRKRHSKLDPLRAFNNEISQHIFLHLDQPTLVSCSAVDKHWRRSATLNYCWYRLYQHAFSFDSLGSAPPGDAIPRWGSGGAKWTRREARTDWKTAFAKARRIEAREAQRAESLPASGSVTPSRTQRMAERGILTAQEARMEQWRAEEESGYSKNEMREFYKAAGNKGGKVKGKTSKGGVKTGLEGDGGLWQ